MNKRLIKNIDELMETVNWASAEFPHATITSPETLPALFVWDAYFSVVLDASLVFMWVYDADFKNVTV